MPRGTGLDLPGTVHHVIIRGIEKREIVADDEDRDIFVSGMESVYNRRHGRYGYLFQNQYKIIVCKEEACFLKLVSYIHLNPLSGVSAVCQIIKTATVAGSA
jgi:putative transposase